MPSFDFDAARRERLAGYDPISFTIGGQSFTARPAIPFEKLLRVVRDDEKLPAHEAFHRSLEFIGSCLPKKDRPRLNKALVNEDEPIEEDEAYAVVAYLVGCYLTRPTQPPSDSSGGRPTTGRRSSSTRRNGSAPKGSGAPTPALSSTGSRSE